MKCELAIFRQQQFHVQTSGLGLQLGRLGLGKLLDIGIAHISQMTETKLGTNCMSELCIYNLNDAQMRDMKSRTFFILQWTAAPHGGRESVPRGGLFFSSILFISFFPLSGWSVGLAG